MTAMAMQPEVRNVLLYGRLGARFGRVHRLAVKSPAEAVHALGVLLDGFTAFLAASKDRGLAYAVFIGKRNVSKEELTWHSQGDIRIAPILIGSKQGGIFQVILGAVLIVVGVVLDAFGQEYGSFFVKLGVAMALGGVVQLLSPHPATNGPGNGPNNIPNYSFNGPVNTQAQGNPVPVFYGGPLVIGGAVISAGISVKHNIIAPTSGASTGSGGGSGGGGGDIRGVFF